MSKILIGQFPPFKLTADVEFLGVYAGAVKMLFEPDFEASPGLCIAVCPSSLKRHAPAQAVDPAWLMSLPAILETLAWGELQVHWQTPELTARVEALELCLAALALEWQVQFSAADQVLSLLAHDAAGVKGFMSLPMFGLEHIGVSKHAAQNLSQLVLPWQEAPEPRQYRVLI